MHILFLSHYFVPENNAPAARVHAMAAEWARLGHRVTVLTGAPNVPAGVVYEGYRNRLYQEEWIDGIRTVRVWTYLAANRGRVRRGLNFLSYMATAGAAGCAAAAARRRRHRHLAAVLRRLGRRAREPRLTARPSCSRSATSGRTRSPPSGRSRKAASSARSRSSSARSTTRPTTSSPSATATGRT